MTSFPVYSSNASADSEWQAKSAFWATIRGMGASSAHLSRTMLECHSQIRMAAKRAAVDAIAKPLEPPILGAGSYQKPYRLPESEIR